MKKIFKFPLIVCLLLVGCSSEEDTSSAVKDSVYCVNETLKKTTKIEPIKILPVEEQITLSGKIEYNENDLVAFRSLVEGYVEQVLFELGDYVKQGQALAVLKSAQIQELYEQKRNYTSIIQSLEKQWMSKKDLLIDGMITVSELQSLESSLQQSKSSLDRIEQTLMLYKARPDGSIVISLPKNGYIIQKSLSVGQTIKSDSYPMFSISNLKEVWVMVNIYASNLKEVHVGDWVKVRTLAYPDNLYEGKIDKIYNVFDDNEHVLKARVVLTNQQLNLMPGLAADIIVSKQSKNRDASAIPNEAIIFNNNQKYIVIYKSDCELEIRSITTLASNEIYHYVSESFNEDEFVVSSNALLLFEHLKK